MRTHPEPSAQEFRVISHLIRCRHDGIRFRSTNLIAQHCGINRRTANTVLQQLAQREWVSARTVSDNEAHELLATKARYSLATTPGSECEWCGAITPVLEKHHHPIKARDGGQETVNICGSCHAEFHFLTESVFYCATEKACLEALA